MKKSSTRKGVAFASNPILSVRLPIRAVDLPSPPLKIIGRVFASDAEVAANPRARSAVMRVAERIAP